MVSRPVGGSLFNGAFSGRRVFVTGHTGFKGAWLVRWLLELGADVTGYALEPPTDPSLFAEIGLEREMAHVVADVRDLDRLRAAMVAARPEYIFHLAAQPLVRLSYDLPVATFETNVMGTVNVLEATRSVPTVTAVVNVTSDKCYENLETGHAYAETDKMGGFDPYSASKGCSELVTAAFRRSFFSDPAAASVATARAGNVIGGGDWAVDRIVPDCVRALTAGEPIVVRNPDAVRPWQHVLEPLSGYLWLAARMSAGGHSFDGPWNFGPEPGEVRTVRAVVEELIAAWGEGTWTTPAETAVAPHEAGLLALDIAKARGDLGWTPVYDLTDAIRATVEWYADRDGDHAAVPGLTARDIDDYVSAARAAGAAWTQ